MTKRFTLRAHFADGSSHDLEGLDFDTQEDAEKKADETMLLNGRSNPFLNKPTSISIIDSEVMRQQLLTVLRLLHEAGMHVSLAASEIDLRGQQATEAIGNAQGILARVQSILPKPKQ